MWFYMGIAVLQAKQNKKIYNTKWAKIVTENQE